MDDPENSKSYESSVQMLQQAADGMHETPNDIYKYICGHIMTQMTATAGIKKHGQAAVDALLQKFCQLDNKDIFDPINASTLTTDQKREALRAVDLIRGAHVRRRPVSEGPLHKRRDNVSHGIHGCPYALTYDRHEGRT